jgi:hypothetical protein
MTPSEFVEMAKQEASTPTPEYEIKENKDIRRHLDGVLQRVKGLSPSRERSLAITKIQEAIMWTGMDLKRLGAMLPKREHKTADQIGREAYHRYGQQTEFKNFRGDPMPKWEELPEKIRVAWMAATQPIYAAQLTEPSPTNPYPNSYNPENTVVDRTAEGLRL